jgi:hypothetical protein
MPKVRLHSFSFALFWRILTAPTAKGLGAPNAPAAKEHAKPGEAPVASDSGNSNVGVDPSANNKGEEGIGGPNYGSR